MTRFRPCIDLHQGRVKQIVGGSLRDDVDPTTNFVSEHDAAWFAQRYRDDQLRGGHIIKLGNDAANDDAAKSALAVWPDVFQIGGGITPKNARSWIDAGARQTIVTSYLFDDKEFSRDRLRQLARELAPHELVIDLSCRRQKDGWYVSTQRWQVTTSTRISPELLDELSDYCCEFLIHAADVEGLCQGIDEQLVETLGHWSPIPCTYAGGASSIEDLKKVQDLSNGQVDLTLGSALDIFGGKGARYRDCVAWNEAQPIR